MVAVDAGLLMFGGVASGDVPFAPECWLLQLGPSPLLGLRENEVCTVITRARACLLHTAVVCHSQEFVMCLKWCLFHSAYPPAVVGRCVHGWHSSSS